MRGILTSIPFALITVICWGSYGPVLHHGKEGMGGNAWAQLLCVGLSYFVITVIVPFYILKTKGEQGVFSKRGVRWGLGAGACGALGALGIITALTNGGSPVYIMPIVFGCAPVVNTFVSIWMGKLFDKMTPGFFLGILLVALGAAGVFAFKPVSATAVAKAVTRALVSRRPRQRYLLGWDTRGVVSLKKILPGRILDWLMIKILFGKAFYR